MDIELLASRAEALIGDEGLTTTALPRVGLFSAKHPVPREPVLYESWVVVQLRGSKLLHHAGREFVFGAGSVLTITPGAPVDCEMHVRSGEPLVSLFLEVRTEELLEAATLAGARKGEDERPPRLMDVSPMDERLFDVCRRLLDLLHDPVDASALGEPTIRELIYRTVQNGPRNELLELAGSRSAAPVLKAVRSLRESYDQEVSVEDLARSVGMSVSSFHEHFKRITGHPPLRYLKGIRLGRARQLLRTGHVTAEQTAIRVGYQSASQFSREYKRYFGKSPAEDRPTRSAQRSVAVG